MIKDKLINELFERKKLNDNEKIELYNIMKDIYFHPEFQKRLTKDFPHHGSFTLGDHIIKDAIVTYKLSKKYEKRKRRKPYNTKLAVTIAMFHDLYTECWQNSAEKPKHFYNKHGFRHPVEAVINAYNWYPEMFKNEHDSKIIIDGILHHMYPLPVTSYVDSKNNKNEIKNYILTSNLDDKIKQIMIDSTKRHKIYKVSLSRSKYKEGRIMSKADRRVASRELNNYHSAKALITGTNKRLLKKIEK